MHFSPTDSDVIPEYLAEIAARLSDRGLGDVEVRSNLAVSEQSFTTAEAARNLLTKARRDLATGQVERAGSYLDRALRLPYDEVEEAPTAAYQAHMLLFTTVAEAVEDSDEDDPEWLDAAEAALPRCGEYAREDLLQTLRVIDHDYQVTSTERRRIRAIAPAGAHTDGVGDIAHDRAGDDEAAQRIVITELLLATTVYEGELKRRRNGN